MKKKLVKSIAVFSAALMMVCFLPSAFASQDSAQKHSMDGMMHGNMNIGDAAKFSLDNATFEIQQERMLEQINDTISMIESDEIDDENITAEMLANATTQLEKAKTIVENAEDVDDLKEARELIRSAMETLGMEPENRHGMGPGTMDDKGMFQGNESFETQQERMLEHINDTLTLIESDEFDNENITAEMLANATTQLEEAKTIVENAEDVDDLKEAGELIRSAMETLGMEPENRHGMEPGDMGNPGMKTRGMDNPEMGPRNRSSGP